MATVDREDDETETKGKKADRTEFLATARKRAKRSLDAFGLKYDASAEDKRFYSGNSDNNNQWPDNVTTMMDPRRPRLTINKLPQFHNQIVNDYRQASIGMRAAPQNDEDVNVAKTYAGLFKQIEKQSYAQVAYIQSLSDAAIGGLGWLRVISDYARPTSFDQDLFIKRVVNPRMVLPDPDATGFFMEDGQFLFFLDKMPLEQYDEEYPDKDATDFIEDDENGMWREDDGQTVVVAEYFYFKTRKRELVQFSDGTTMFADEITNKKGANEHIVRRRKADFKELHWCKIDGFNVLDEEVWGAPRIPFIPVWGNELWVDGDRTFEGQVRGAKDSQRIYNYMQSTKTEMIALSPKAPYIAAEGQLEGREDEWRDAATTAKSVLYYKPTTVDGIIVPPPQRQSYEAPVQAVIQASMQASDDMKAVLGVYDASLGARGNEVSGRAINARKQEGDTATYNFVDNLSMAIGYMGTVIAELIPVYYDNARQIRIITPEDQMQVVKINGGDDQPNLVDVQYDLVLDTGPSYSTQRQEAVAIITELSNNYPKLMEVGGDIAIGNMSFKGAREIADRLKRTLPPQVVGEDEDPQTKLAAALNQLEQVKQVVEQLAASVKEKDAKLAEQALDLRNKAGELKIKQQELSLKRSELDLKRQEAGESAASTTSDESSVLSAISDLTMQVTELASMVEAAVHEDAPAAPDQPAPDAAPSPVTPPTTAPTTEE